jgi:menaquinone-specific isochorismate synthase
MILPIIELKAALLSFISRLDISYNKEGILINFAYKIEDINFTYLVDPVITNNKKVFYFNRPEEKLTILAFEEAYSIKINGLNKFSVLGDKISAISKKLISNIDSSNSIKIPLFLGGTKFSSGKGSEEWKDFADNDWFIPRFLFYKKDEEQWLVVNFFLIPNPTADVQINCLMEQVCRFNKEGSLFPKVNEAIQIHSHKNGISEWNNMISEAVNKINGGLFKKVVLSRRVSADIKSSLSFNYFLSELKQNYQNCTVFLYKSENSILFGATPEQLLKLKDNSLEFDALAGSAKRGRTKEEDDKLAYSLLRDKKNSDEHNHVIDFIKDTASAYVKNLRLFDTGIKKFSNIQHIYTPIKAELNSFEQIFRLVDAIFPTPAICGYPKRPSYDYIIDSEKFDRGLFCGIIGLISPGELDLVVAIRSALLNNNKLYVYAGCGIVKGSSPASEYEETELKMEPILSLFNNENK